MGRRMQKRLAALVCCGLLVLFLLSKLFWRPPTDWVLDEVRVVGEALGGGGGGAGGARSRPEDDPQESHARWIVVTTIQQPTHALRELVKFPGWKMVVVGDRKTPASWSLPGVKFLDLSQQEHLGYTVTSLLPYDNYARKVLGYLYAIQHGAEVIYEVDDDNLPMDDLHSFHTTSPVSALTVCTTNLSYNPYVHFGQSTTWPRGFPLEHIGEPTPHNYVLRTAMHAPAIQQGLTNADPDVDAIFRLTRKHAQTPMDLNFDTHAPPVVLPYGTFAPTNSQNTLYRYKAFWALVLPATTSFRTCDIYRSYWAQRLLWLVAGQVGFYPPNIIHRRNKHNTISDAKQETDFIRMGELLESLRRWQCSRMHFFSCISDLARHMVSAGFWQQIDVDIVDAWLQDLSGLGYIPPSLKDPQPTLCSGSDSQLQEATFYPYEQPTSLPHSIHNFLPHSVLSRVQVWDAVTSVCAGQVVLQPPPVSRMNAPVGMFSDTLLVIHMNGQPDAIPILEAWYRASFPNILYCITSSQHKQINPAILHYWRVSAVSLPNEAGAASCIAMATKMGYNVSGYLYAPETAFLQAAKLRSHSPTQMWMTQDIVVDDAPLQTLCRQGAVRCLTFSRDVLTTLSTWLPRLDMGSKFKTKLKQCFNKMGADPRLANSVLYLSDVVHYLPSRLTNLFTQITDVYLSDPEVTRYDIITMLMLECIEITPEYLVYGSITGSRSNADYIFPFHMTKMLKKDSQHVKFYCDHIRH